jgi:hypothetical protein
MKLHKDHSKVVMDYNWLCTFNINNEYVYTAWQKGVNTHIARFILLLASGLNWGDSIVAFQPQSDPYSMSLVTFGL